MPRAEVARREVLRKYRREICDIQGRCLHRGKVKVQSVKKDRKNLFYCLGKSGIVALRKMQKIARVIKTQN